MDVDEDPSVRAFVFEAAWFIGSSDHGDAVGELVDEAEIPVGIVEGGFGLGAFCGDFDGAGVVGVHSKLGEVDDVGTAVGHFAAAVCKDESPPEVTSARVVWDFGCVAEPCVEVEACGYLMFLFVEDVCLGLFMVVLVAGEVDADGFEFSDAPVADEFGGVSAVGV